MLNKKNISILILSLILYNSQFDRNSDFLLISQPVKTHLFNQLKKRFSFDFLGTMELLSKYQYIKFIAKWFCF